MEKPAQAEAQKKNHKNKEASSNNKQARRERLVQDVVILVDSVSGATPSPRRHFMSQVIAHSQVCGGWS